MIQKTKADEYWVSVGINICSKCLLLSKPNSSHFGRDGALDTGAVIQPHVSTYPLSDSKLGTFEDLRKTGKRPTVETDATASKPVVSHQSFEPELEDTK